MWQGFETSTKLHLVLWEIPLCGRFWKYVLVIDYLPIGSQLASLCKSSSHCLESLELWRQWGRWLGKTPSFQSENIFEFWDGTKMRAYQAFWDPNAQWELLVICTNNNCKSIYRAVPNPYMEIIQGWDVSTQQYKFCRWKCSTLIVCAKQTKEVCVHDLIQMVFSTHWFFFGPLVCFFCPFVCFFCPLAFFCGLFVFCPMVCFFAHCYVFLFTVLFFLPTSFFSCLLVCLLFLPDGLFFCQLVCFFSPLNVFSTQWIVFLPTGMFFFGPLICLFSVRAGLFFYPLFCLFSWLVFLFLYPLVCLQLAHFFPLLVCL